MGRFWAGWMAALALSMGLACGGTTKRDGRADGGSGGETAAGEDNRYVDQIRQAAVDKIDLLLVVDNSISMADKQALLAQAMPLLVQRFITPRCVRACTPADNCSANQERDGISTESNADARGRCASGTPELPPITDLHVGVITSSLGSHRPNGDRDVCAAADDDDHAHLLGELHGLAGTWNGTGFLAWDPRGQKSPAGDSDPAVFLDKFTTTIRSAGEHGCGYESTLEAWYRFLVDPEPPRSIVVEDGKSVTQGIDQTVLDQRAQFLRPDSVVAIVMLTDENDCSIIDEGQGYLVASTAEPMARMFRGTSVCALNPNDHCCQSCGDSTANDGCPAIAADAECQKGQMLAAGDDDLNLRCWQQKRRFGIDLLYPTTRYAKALSSRLVRLRSGESVPNPLFRAAQGGVPRDPGLVFLAGIVGVPWQDLADPESLNGPGLRYMTGAELEQTGRWDVVLGRPEADPPVLPSDPLMHETPLERTGRNPVTNSALVPATSTNPQANPINGHEQVNVGARDLQYACTFPLSEPRVCNESDDRGCDCYPDDVVFNRPLCQPPSGGPATSTQYYAKAYPGLRHLAVLKELGDQAIVASTCPKILELTNPDYGYNPAINTLVARVKEALVVKCFPRELPVDADGSVPCAVVESLPPEQPCDCLALGHKAVSEELATQVRRTMKAQAVCDGDGGAPCSSICLCEVPQFSGEDLSTCQDDPVGLEAPGFCYINANPGEAHVGNPELVGSCSPDSRRLIRFSGRAFTKGATEWIACEGLSLSAK